MLFNLWCKIVIRPRILSSTYVCMYVVMNICICICNSIIGTLNTHRNTDLLESFATFFMNVMCMYVCMYVCMLRTLCTPAISTYSCYPYATYVGKCICICMEYELVK